MARLRCRSRNGAVQFWSEFGNTHQIQFNKSLILPLLYRGWQELGHFYQINDYSLISFSYLGESVFHINLFRGPVPTNEFPRFHTKTTSITKNRAFLVKMPNNSWMERRALCFFFSSSMTFTIKFHHFLSSNHI